MNPHRTTELGNGRKVYERYIGGDPYLRDSERPEAWERVELDADGDPYRYRVSEDVQIGVAHNGTVLISIAGVTFGIPDELLDGFDALLDQARRDARARRAAFAKEAGGGPA